MANRNRGGDGGVDPESFRVSLDEGVDHVVEAGADLILMNMQYSPHTETMISLSNYADIMQVVARDREVPLFDRREIMRYWNDNGNFDLNRGVNGEEAKDMVARLDEGVLSERPDLILWQVGANSRAARHPIPAVRSGHPLKGFGA